jgi:hypothetical protein
MEICGGSPGGGFLQIKTRVSTRQAEYVFRDEEEDEISTSVTCLVYTVCRRRVSQLITLAGGARRRYLYKFVGGALAMQIDYYVNGVIGNKLRWVRSLSKGMRSRAGVFHCRAVTSRMIWWRRCVRWK